MEKKLSKEVPHRRLANALRFLAVDAVERARSGHPGAPLGMADIAEVLWRDHLKHNPNNPAWPDRDRFVLSNGHGSMLLYALLHLTGYDLPLSELQNFRQFGSRTAGHPEVGHTPGVETTTGPLGQGLANAVGMALAEKLLAQRYNRPGHEIVGHRTWVFMGDGCLMEGISHEACSLAGVWGLNKLVAIYDDNGISIDGHVSGSAAESRWQERFAAYARAYPEPAAEFVRTANGALPDDWTGLRQEMEARAASRTDGIASRKSSQNCLDFLTERLPELLGASADLTGSNLTAGRGSRPWHEAPPGGAQAPNYLSCGVREFGMAAVMNGVALHRGLIPYGGTFAVFSDYARNAIRMSALMRLRVIHVLTHDSIGLGEDGPTHQPIEHLGSLRLIPGLDTWRPCDELETAVAWAEALARADGPSALFLSRQNLPQCGGDAGRAARIARGGYVLSPAAGEDQAAILATGSEVGIALAAQQCLAAQEVAVRVVSMPCCERFDRQDVDWRHQVLPDDLPRVAIEAAHPDPWRKYVGLDGAVLGIASFGASAPASALYAYFGLDVAHLVRAVLDTIVRQSGSDGDF
jgi:transketolase